MGAFPPENEEVVGQTARHIITVSRARPVFRDEWTPEDAQDTYLRVWSKEKTHCLWGCLLQDFPDPQPLTEVQRAKAATEGLDPDQCVAAHMIWPRGLVEKILPLRDAERAKAYRPRPVPIAAVPMRHLPDVHDSIGDAPAKVLVPESALAADMMRAYVRQIVPDTLEVYAPAAERGVGERLDVPLEEVSRFQPELNGWLVSYSSTDERFLPYAAEPLWEIFEKKFTVALVVRVEDDGTVRWEIQEDMGSHTLPMPHYRHGTFGPHGGDGPSMSLPRTEPTRG